MKVLLTGASGMVGSCVAQVFSSKHEIISLSTSMGIDLTHNEMVDEYLQKNTPDAIVHLAAKANVDECEKDKKIDTNYIGELVEKNFDVLEYTNNNHEAWRGKSTSFAINVIGTYNIAKIASKKNIPFIYISTDFVFDGTKDSYSEDDEPNPTSWYGMTKLLGETVAKGIYSKSITTRISYPYGPSPSEKKDFVRKMIDYLKDKGALTLIADQIITPTYMNDIADGLDFILCKGYSSEIFHLVGNTSLTPYDIGALLVKKLAISADLSKVKGKDFFKDRAPRPFILKMKNDKLKKLGFQTLGFEDGLEKLLKNIN